MKQILLQFAQKIDAGSVGIPEASPNDLLLNGLNLTYFIAGVVAVVTIIFAGIMYTASNGDAGRVTKAKNLLLYAIIGLVIILVAFAITNFVIGRFSS